MPTLNLTPPPNVTTTRTTRSVASYSVRAADVETPESGNGHLEGVGCRVGMIDSYNTVPMPNSRAFTAEGLAEFVERGMVLAAHDWGGPPMATIESCQMDGRDMRFVAEFHSDAESQSWRTRLAERANRGKRTGLSIGFEVSTYWMFNNGNDFCDMIAEMGMDMSLFDVDAIRAVTDESVWAMFVDRTFEVSPVVVESNGGSSVVSVRSGSEIGKPIPLETPVAHEISDEQVREMLADIKRLSP